MLKEAMQLRTPVKYGEYEIKPRNESGWYPFEDNFGWWVVKNGVNIMPGACWFREVQDAIKGIKKLELAKHNADLFWLLMGNGGGLTIRATHVPGGINNPAARFEVNSQASKNASVQGRRGNAKLEFHFKKLKLEMTPEEALAAAAILIDGAERTLGKEI